MIGIFLKIIVVKSDATSTSRIIGIQGNRIKIIGDLEKVRIFES